MLAWQHAVGERSITVGRDVGEGSVTGVGEVGRDVGEGSVTGVGGCIVVGSAQTTLD